MRDCQALVWYTEGMQNGITPIAIILIVLGVLVIGGGGYYVSQNGLDSLRDFHSYGDDALYERERGNQIIPSYPQTGECVNAPTPLCAPNTTPICRDSAWYCESSINEAYSQFCETTSDCILETELNPNCSHFCSDEECRGDLRTCGAYYRYSKGNKELKSAICKWNEPCKKPSSVECVNNTCVAL